MDNFLPYHYCLWNILWSLNNKPINISEMKYNYSHIIDGRWSGEI